MRADIYLFRYGYARSRQNAKALIESGTVCVDGKILNKPSADIDENAEHSVVISDAPKFVSRGGEKLEHALDTFGVSPEGKICIDIGASTGGFTDCLLRRGASRVFAVDSGHSQLAPELAANARVVSIEKYNARYMKPTDFSATPELAVMDVSFISQTLIHESVFSVLADGGELIALVKPQFECGRAALNSHGIVKERADHLAALEKVVQSACAVGFACTGITRSPIEGGSGNVEFLAHLVKGGEHNAENVRAWMLDAIGSKK